MSRKSVWKALGIAILAIGIILVFTGCGGDDGGIVGKWSNSDKGEKLEFKSDGTLTINSESEGDLTFTYEVKGSQILLGMEGFTETTPIDFEVKGDTLTISSEGETTKYQRQ